MKTKAFGVDLNPYYVRVDVHYETIHHIRPCRLVRDLEAAEPAPWNIGLEMLESIAHGFGAS
jgi:hypothetical protein